jgi:hypothetical protein
MSEQDEETTKNNSAGRKRFSKKTLFFLVPALAILMVVLFFAFNIYRPPDFNVLLARAKLAKLPVSAQNLKVDIRPVTSRGRVVPHLCELFIKFQAEPNDINNFIASSPGLDKSRCRPLVPLSNSDDVPAWWPTDQSTSGRFYTCFKQKDIHGAIFVYDDSNTVRIGIDYVANPEMRDAQLFLEDLKDNVEDSVDDLIHEVSDVFGH